ncbi:MAG: barstar family protein [Eubacterium sp.]
MNNKSITIDFSNCEYIGSLHKEIKEKLNLPDWYGENLDALWDSLIGLVETPVDIKIIYKPKNNSAKRIKPYVDQIISIFNEAMIQFHEINLTIEK